MDNILSPIKQRTLQFVEYKGIVKDSFYKKIGIASSNFKGKGVTSELGGDKIVKILTEYPMLNPSWLLLGEGEMLRSIVPAAQSVIAEPTAPYDMYTLGVLKHDRKKSIQRVPLYDIRATGGIVELLNDSERSKFIPIDYISIPNLPKCDGALPITGDSMYPLLKSGDTVLYREVNDKKNIIWGEMYLVAVVHNGDEFFFAKYVQKAEREGWVKLVSQNANHQPVEFPMDSIVAIALIKASIRINTQF